MRDFSDQLFRLITKDSGPNLTSIKNADEFYELLVLDSVEPLNSIPLYKKIIEEVGLVIDVGFGGGFPLLPLAYKLPHVRFLGIEGRKKKVAKVNSFANHLKLKNVSCFHLRLEEIHLDCPVVLTFKAVGAVEEVLPKIHYLKTVYTFFYKGPFLFKKEKLSKIKKNWQQILLTPYHIPNADGRILIGFKGCGNFGKTTLQKNQKYTKLSEIL